MNYTSTAGSSRWITIGLIALLLSSVAFVGWAVYATQFNQENPHKVVDIDGIRTIPGVPQFSCPLDGTVVTDRDEASKRPIIFQVDNAPAARPQSGLSQADIVYEAMAEGDITRFSAIFACHEADVVGPVRSARLIMLELVPEYDALLSNSGASEGVSGELEAAGFSQNINHVTYGQAYWRAEDRVAPHDLMTSTKNIREAASAAGFAVADRLQPLTFKDDTPAPSISRIGIPYSPITDVSYQYDGGSNSWLRFVQGEPHMDTLTSAQLAPKNVIVQYVSITESDIEEDVGGNRGLVFNLQGSGRVQIFRDGQAYEGTWNRPDATSVTQYVDAAGKPIPLNRGLTFIQLVPVDFQINVS